MTLCLYRRFVYFFIDSRFVILFNGDLLIRNTSRHDSGYYRCQTRHELSQETVLSSIEGHFIVNGKCSHSLASLETILSHPFLQMSTAAYHHEYLLSRRFVLNSTKLLNLFASPRHGLSLPSGMHLTFTFLACFRFALSGKDLAELPILCF